MSANTPVVNRWTKRIPFALIILAVALALSYLTIAPLPTFSLPASAPASVSSLQRGQEAYAARYTAMAQAFAAQGAASVNIQRSRVAETARYTAMAEAFAAKEAAGIQRSWDAYAARYTAMGKQIGRAHV